jgi:hypothetical protein
MEIKNVMKEKSIDELEKELEDLRESNKGAWEMWGSELCAGHMERQEAALKKEILKRKGELKEKPKQFLALADDLFQPLRKGDKKLTIRRGRRDIELGSLIFEGTNDKTLWEEVEVVEVRYLRISDVSKKLCQSDGFKNWVDFYQGMKKYYPDLDVSEECTVIKFK